MSTWNAQDPVQWERQTLEKLLQAQVTEQRRARRWGIFFKLLVFIYLFALLFLVRGADLGLSEWLDRYAEPTRHVAVIDIEGLIASATRVNAEDINRTLRRAFEDDETAAVMLRINSGGGSPVQAGMIHDEILRLRELHEAIPVYAVIEDIGASGAYYIAVAADEIYADKGSIVGSIGVRLDSFGLVGLMERLGVERRLFTAGENKGFLDPFLPLQQDEVDHIEGVIGQIHQQFIDVVRTGRGGRLSNNDDLFSGLVWTGADSVELGLIDGLGNDRSVARDVIGIEELVVFKPKQRAWKMLLDDLGIAVADRILGWESIPQWR
ncbi:Periplasmic serine proteases (ClpP class) [Thioalkalivibrio nitratireducens DSM 14787]|uniref:Periplasmic serine proteases (ClpP class) n=1 Tax=Thioalkalivibrio nitratireducens (strain DSM 14787 / UNIQEM 213 / ALEN2) TaxID=1255043 RepID=L0DWV8_THIND|nr:S49 family peptidase [Thioalkalivibrio nitratireducens]AGA33487.1 Periplasmic serine proteases (ClpP class) [Thioalkalivibrio nitratireducens DSM 14787]